MIITLDNYTIQFQNKSFTDLNIQLKKANYSKVFVLVDNNTQQFCLPILEKALSNFDLIPIKILAGEAYKNISTCQEIWSFLLEHQADRKAVLLNLGGGVIGDMGGFCASTYKRGIDFIQIPTTLLSQVDASIGGKLAIDFGLVKNSIGLFQNPKGVYLFPDFFETLPRAELYSGFAEVIKHSLILDKDYWQQLLAISDIKNSDWETIIRHSLSIKKSIVEQDPFEKNVRKSLNFGHTIGHAVESLSWETSKPLLHGEAVALGMITESFLSYKLLNFPKTELDRIHQYILRLYPKYNLKKLNKKAILDLIHQDKKNEQNQSSFTLLEEIGQFKINIIVEDKLILDALDFYSN